MILKRLNESKNTIMPPQVLRRWYDNEWGYSNRIVDLVRYMHLSDKESNNLQGREYVHYSSF